MDFDWETLPERSTIARFCSLFKAYFGEGTWKAIHDRLRGPYYLSKFNHVRKISDRKQRTDIEKCSFVNRNIKNWNRLLLHNFPL
jgi:transposase